MIRVVRPGRARGTVRAPGSKSYTHRALAVGYVGRRSLTIVRPLDSDDTRATAVALGRLGTRVVRAPGAWDLRPPATNAPARTVTIDCNESGTTLRLVTAIAALGGRPVRFVGRGRLPLRPMESLLRPLEELGATVVRAPSGRSLPFTLRGPIGPGSVEVEAGDSSQPISALLIALGGLKGRSQVRARGPVVSRPYIDATVAWMRARGLSVRSLGDTFVVRGPSPARERRVVVPGDASSAAYAWAAAVTSGGSVLVRPVEPQWPQADLRVLALLRSMGAEVRRVGDSVRVAGRARRGVRADLTDSPDLFPLIGAVAATIPGRTSQLSGAPQLRHKESDRGAETARLARALGARVEQRAGSLRITGPADVLPLDIADFSDHRLVMSAAVAALSAPGPSRIGASEAVRKSYPEFWTMLAGVTGSGGARP